MATYTQILYQIVFSTKNRNRWLTKPNRNKLFRFMSGILKNKKCHLYQINGVANHLHIVTHIHPSVSLANLVKDLKISSSIFIKKENLFPGFDSWQIGYSAFTYSQDAKANLIAYVKNQEIHHKEISAKQELRDLLEEHEVEYDEKYFE